MSDVRAIAEETARASYGRLLAWLSARTRDVSAAEDALADAKMLERSPGVVGGARRLGSSGGRALGARRVELRAQAVERDPEAAEAPAEFAIEIQEPEMEPGRHGHAHPMRRARVFGKRRGWASCLRQRNYLCSETDPGR